MFFFLPKIVIFQKEYKELKKDSVEGCVVWLADEANFLVWQVGIFGPPETIFQGAYFKVQITPDWM